jgi:hypothetical protein
MFEGRGRILLVGLIMALITTVWLWATSISFPVPPRVETPCAPTPCIAAPCREIPRLSPSPKTSHPPPPSFPRLKWPSEAFGLGVIPLTSAEIINAIGPTNFYAVNLGANDGKYTDGDPVNALWFGPDARWKAKGLAVEGVQTLCTTLISSLNTIKAGVKTSCSFVIPQTVVALFKEYKVPLDLDFLKVDIDSIDCPVLEAILEHYQPKYIHMESNYDIPPPLVFSIEYSPALTENWFWKTLPADFKGFYGCSLSRIVQIARRFGYDLIQANNIDVELVRRDFSPRFGNISHDAAYWWKTGVLPHCVGGGHFLNPGSCAAWIDMPPRDALLAMWTYITTKLPIETIRKVPFRLYLDTVQE